MERKLAKMETYKLIKNKRVRNTNILASKMNRNVSTNPKDNKVIYKIVC